MQRAVGLERRSRPTDYAVRLKSHNPKLPAQPTRERLSLTPNAHFRVGVLLLCPSRAHSVPVACPENFLGTARDDWFTLHPRSQRSSSTSASLRERCNASSLSPRRSARVLSVSVSLSGFG
jgi:hypothetical protein